MGLNRILGYIIIVIGLLGIVASSVPALKSGVPGLSDLDDTILLVISLLIVLVGAFIIIKSRGLGGSRKEEVPIYHGKEIVGYRRR